MTDSRSTQPDVSSPSATETMGVGTPTKERAPEVRNRRRRGLWVMGVVAGLILVGLVLTVAWAIVWTLGRSTDSVTETFAGTIDQVIIEDVNGTVTLEAGATTEMTARREWLLGNRPDVEMVQEGGTLRISADCGTWCRTHVTGTSLAGARVVVRTGAGDVDLIGFQGGVDLVTSAGDVTVRGIRGPAVMRSDAGRIQGDVTDGDVDAETSAGGIDLQIRGEFSRVSAVSSAGSVQLGVPDEPYRVEAEASAGRTDVNVATDPEAAREIVVRSGAGNVTIDRLAD